MKNHVTVSHRAPQNRILKDHPMLVGASYGTAAGLVARLAVEALWWILP